MQLPLVSVIMGVYNGEEYLQEAIDSILNQTFEDFEFLIINDGSTDKGADILKRVSDPRLRVYDNERNEGLTRCLIRGCSEARSKYIARMDADDISYPMRFQKQVEFLETNSEYAVVGTQCHFIDAEGKVCKTSDRDCSDEKIRQALQVSPPFIHGSTMFVREHIQKCGGYREIFRYTQDYDLWLRVIEKHKMANLPDVLYGLRYHRAAISQKKYFLQSRYADLARDFAHMRSTVGSDSIMRGEIAQLQREISSWDFLETTREVRSDIALHLARDAIQWAKLSDVCALWLAALSATPFNGKVWKFLFSSSVKRRFGRYITDSILSRAAK